MNALHIDVKRKAIRLAPGMNLTAEASLAKLGAETARQGAEIDTMRAMMAKLEATLPL